MRRRVAAALAGVLAAACARKPAGGAAGESKPSVLLVTIDTLRADRVGAYGYAQARTPHLDALAREGLVYERAYTTMPTTGPAHVSLFTGLAPHEHGSDRNGAPMHPAHREIHVGPAMEQAALDHRAGCQTGQLDGYGFDFSHRGVCPAELF